MPKNFGKNLMKSFKYGVVDSFVEAAVPDFKKMIDHNTESLGSEDFSFKNIFNETKAYEKISNDLKGAKKSFKESLKDIKKGHIFGNKAKEMAGFDMGMGLNNDDAFDFGDFGDDDSSGSSNTSSSENVGSINYSPDNRRAVSNINQVNNFNAANSQFLQNVSNSLVSGLSVVATEVNHISEFHNSNTIQYYDKASQYYDESLNYLKNISETLSKTYNLDKANTTFDVLDNIFGGGGLFDIKSYITEVTKGFKEFFEEGGMYDLFVSSTIKNFASNPIKTLIGMSASIFIPSTLQASFDTFNEKIKDLPKSLLLQLSDGKNGEGSPLQKMLGSIFGLDLDKSVFSSSAQARANYKKDAVPFDGITRKAIVEVIPTYLSKILAAVSHSDEELIMDYEKGVFTTSKLARISKKEQEESDLNFNYMRTTESVLNGYKDNVQFTDKEKKEIERLKKEKEDLEKKLKDEKDERTKSELSRKLNLRDLEINKIKNTNISNKRKWFNQMTKNRITHGNTLSYRLDKDDIMKMAKQGIPLQDILEYKKIVETDPSLIQTLNAETLDYFNTVKKRGFEENSVPKASSLLDILPDDYNLTDEEKKLKNKASMNKVQIGSSKRTLDLFKELDHLKNNKDKLKQEKDQKEAYEEQFLMGSGSIFKRAPKYIFDGLKKGMENLNRGLSNLTFGNTDGIFHNITEKFLDKVFDEDRTISKILPKSWKDWYKTRKEKKEEEKLEHLRDISETSSEFNQVIKQLYENSLENKEIQEGQLDNLTRFTNAALEKYSIHTSDLHLRTILEKMYSAITGRKLNRNDIETKPDKEVAESKLNVDESSSILGTLSLINPLNKNKKDEDDEKNQSYFTKGKNYIKNFVIGQDLKGQYSTDDLFTTILRARISESIGKPLKKFIIGTDDDKIDKDKGLFSIILKKSDIMLGDVKKRIIGTDNDKISDEDNFLKVIYKKFKINVIEPSKDLLLGPKDDQGKRKLPKILEKNKEELKRIGLGGLAGGLIGTMFLGPLAGAGIGMFMSTNKFKHDFFSDENPNSVKMVIRRALIGKNPELFNDEDSFISVLRKRTMHSIINPTKKRINEYLFGSKDADNKTIKEGLFTRLGKSFVGYLKENAIIDKLTHIFETTINYTKFHIKVMFKRITSYIGRTLHNAFKRTFNFISGIFKRILGFKFKNGESIGKRLGGYLGKVISTTVNFGDRIATRMDESVIEKYKRNDGSFDFAKAKEDGNDYFAKQYAKRYMNEDGTFNQDQAKAEGNENLLKEYSKQLKFQQEYRNARKEDFYARFDSENNKRYKFDELRLMKERSKHPERFNNDGTYKEEYLKSTQSVNQGDDKWVGDDVIKAITDSNNFLVEELAKGFKSVVSAITNKPIEEISLGKTDKKIIKEKEEEINDLSSLPLKSAATNSLAIPFQPITKSSKKPLTGIEAVEGNKQVQEVKQAKINQENVISYLKDTAKNTSGIKRITNFFNGIKNFFMVGIALFGWLKAKLIGFYKWYHAGKMMEWAYLKYKRGKILVNEGIDFVKNAGTKGLNIAKKVAGYSKTAFNVASDISGKYISPALRYGGGKLAQGAKYLGTAAKGRLATLGVGGTALAGAGLIGGGMSIYDDYQQAKLSGRKGFGLAAQSLLGRTGDTVGEMIENAGKQALKYGQIGAAVGTVFPGVGTIFGGLMGAGLGFLGGLIGSNPDKIINNIKRPFVEIGNKISKFFSSVTSAVSDFGKWIWDKGKWVLDNTLLLPFRIMKKVLDATGITDMAVLVKDAVKKAFGSLYDFISNPIGFVKDMVFGSSKAEASDGKKPSITNDKKTTRQRNLPKLAEGGYVEANNPKLAVIGDNKTQGEIIAPEGKIYNVVKMAIQDSNGTGNKPVIGEERGTQYWDGTSWKSKSGLKIGSVVGGLVWNGSSFITGESLKNKTVQREFIEKIFTGTTSSKIKDPNKLIEGKMSQQKGLIGLTETSTKGVLGGFGDKIKSIFGFGGSNSSSSSSGGSSSSSGGYVGRGSNGSYASSGNVVVSGNDNGEKIWNFLTGNMGLGPEDSAAILGNLMQESGLRTKTGGSFDGNGSEGLAQWTFGRKTALIDFANQNGLDPYSIEAQLGWLQHELTTTHSHAMDAMKSANGIEAKTIAFGRKFEVPAEKYAYWDKRSEYARQFFNAYKGIRPNSNNQGMNANKNNTSSSNNAPKPPSVSVGGGLNSQYGFNNGNNNTRIGGASEGGGGAGGTTLSNVSDVRKRLVQSARSLVGIGITYSQANRESPYPNGSLDCSSLTGNVYDSVLGKGLSHYAGGAEGEGYGQWIESVPTNNPQPGDLVWWNTAGAVDSHVGIITDPVNTRAIACNCSTGPTEFDYMTYFGKKPTNIATPKILLEAEGKGGMINVGNGFSFNGGNQGSFGGGSYSSGGSASGRTYDFNDARLYSKSAAASANSSSYSSLTRSVNDGTTSMQTGGAFNYKEDLTAIIQLLTKIEENSRGTVEAVDKANEKQDKKDKEQAKEVIKEKNTVKEVVSNRTEQINSMTKSNDRNDKIFNTTSKSEQSTIFAPKITQVGNYKVNLKPSSIRIAEGN